MMKVRFVLGIVGLLICSMQGRAQVTSKKDPVDYVNPYIGTDKSSHPTVWSSQGGTFPGVLVPFGMVQITPNGYSYPDNKISWFSFLNHCSGWFSTGNFLMMASTGSVDSPFVTATSAFTHSREKTSPFYYSVFLDDYKIQVAYTSTARVGFCQFIFPKSSSSHLFLSDLSQTRVLSSKEIQGKSNGYYFTAHFDKPFISSRNLPGGIQINYTTSEDEVVLVKIAFSHNSFEASLDNLQREMPGWDFEQAWKDNRKIWNDHLSRITIKATAATPSLQQQKELFYTAMYHSLFMPSIISDAGEKLNTYGPVYPWDTYRSVHPLLTILDPERETDMISSTLAQYDSTGWLPTGNMMGNHNFEVILDAYVKGLTHFDVKKASEAIRKSAMQPPYARRQMASYAEKGYVPSDITSSVTHTLEFAYDDWAAADFMELTGRNKNDSEDYKQLLQRSLYYKNVFDPATSFMHAKTMDRKWTTSGYAEGTEWTYSFYVPHDVQGLINLMGGPEKFCKKLTECFEAGHYVHDNEPPLHYAYLFDFAGQPWKTQQWARHIVENSYSTDPGGLPGNDDLGALSSWYVFSALGIYPVTPGRPVYEIGSPVFEETTIHLSNGNNFTVKAHHVSGINKYIQSATLDGRPLNKPWITHEDIMHGKILVFEMGPAPNRYWASDIKNAPPSLTKGSPSFVFSDMKLSANKIKAGDSISVSVLLENKGSGTGTATWSILVDGKMKKQAFSIIDPGTKKRVITDLNLYQSSYHEISIKGLKPQKILLQKVIPTFQYSGLKTPMPPLVHTTDSFFISATVKNRGSAKGIALAKLYINDRESQSRKIMLGAGEEKEIRFFSSIEKQGLYKVSIDTLKPAIIRILGNEKPGLPDSSFLAQLKAALVLDFDLPSDHVLKDQSGRGNNAIVRGNVKWVDGLFGKAIQTDGPNGAYIEIPDNPEMDKLLQSPTMTMMAWVYPMEEQNFADIIAKGDWNSLQIKGGNSVINFYTGGWEGREASATVPDNWNRHWHHIAGVTQPPYERLYIDGKLAATKLIEPRDPNGETGLTNYSFNKWNIGRNEGAPERAFKGYIDDVMIFESPLTQEQIFDLMLHMNSKKY